MKQNFLRRAGALALTLAMLLSLVVIPAAAADEEPIILKINETKRLSVSDLAQGDTVAWASSNERVATVDNTGNVKAIAIGQTTITATVTSSTTTPPETPDPPVTPDPPDSGTTRENRTVTFVVEVTDVTNIQLDKKILTLFVDDTEQLTATVTPSNPQNGTVTWSSSDVTIATVDGNGLVTAIKEGQATITVKAGASTDTCTVTVAPAVPPDGIYFINTTSANTVQFNRTDARSRQMGIIVSPDNATFDPEDVTWTTIDPTVAKVEKDISGKTGTEGILTAVAPGETRMIVTIGNLSAECRVIVSGIRLNRETLTMIEGKRRL